MDSNQRSDEFRQTVIDYISAAHSYGCRDELQLIYGAWPTMQRTAAVSIPMGLYQNSNGTDQSISISHRLIGPRLHLHLRPWKCELAELHLRPGGQRLVAYPFDGWQADQLGNPGTVYTASGMLATPICRQSMLPS